MTTRTDELAVQIAKAIDRRGFLRRVARTGFVAAAATSVGAALDGVFAVPALAYASSCAQSEGDPVGPGCPNDSTFRPYPCGPSRCCNYTSGKPSGCGCSSGNATCLSGTTHCKGKAGTWSGTSCWTCTGNTYGPNGCLLHITTCCDCATSGCGDSSNRCISYSVITKKVC